MSPDSQKRRVLVCASGSGGHLFPARYIIEELKAKGLEVSFLGAGAPLEPEILGKLDIALFSIPYAKVQNRGVAGWLKFILSLPRAINRTLNLFLEIRPQAILCVGGYATVLPAILGRLTGRVIWIHECELQAGLANRWLAYVAHRISLSHEESKVPCKGKQVYTGQPVRTDIFEIAGKSRRVDRPQNLLILGGSQGARSLDQVMLEIAPELGKLGIKIWHQARSENIEELELKYQQLEIEAKVMPFVHDLATAYEWSHIIVSRAGAGATMEILVVNRPAIFVPFPHAQGDHQRLNAELLVKQGKALMVQEGEGFPEQLLGAIQKNLDPAYYNKIRVRAASLRPKNAAETIAEGVIQMIEAKSSST